MQAGLATRPDSVPDIAEIDAPVLAICGGEDPGITEAEMRAFEAREGGCEFHLLADAGHFAAYEQPEKVAAMHGAVAGAVRVLIVSADLKSSSHASDSNCESVAECDAIGSKHPVRSSEAYLES